MPLRSFRNILPTFGQGTWLAPSADLIGDVQLGSDCSVWFNVTIRGDVNHIRIGNNTNVQDGTVIHVTTTTYPTIIGSGVTIGHGVILHGCTLGDHCLIGMGASILDGAVVQSGAFVAAASLVAPGKIVPSGVLYAGVPGKIVRELTQKEKDFFAISAENYRRLKDTYLESEK